MPIAAEAPTTAPTIPSIRKTLVIVSKLFIWFASENRSGGQDVYLNKLGLHKLNIFQKKLHKKTFNCYIVSH